MKSRKQRKLEAKLNGETFTPKYNSAVVVSFEDYHGVGNERFDNKFVQFLKPSETPNELSEGILKINQDGVSIEKTAFNLTSNSDGNEVTVGLEVLEESFNDVIYHDKVNDQLVIDGEINVKELKVNDNVVLEELPKPKKDKSKKGKFKQKLKKLFSK